MTGLITLAAPAGELDRAAIEKEIAEQRTAHGWPGVAVGIVHADKLVFAQGFGMADVAAGRPVTPETQFPICSITKVFTTTLLAQLRDDGVLQLDDPLTRHLPDVKPPSDPRGALAITLRHLATHTSGLPSLPGNFATDAGNAQLDPYDRFSAARLQAGVAETRLSAPIGAAFAYSNFGMALLGAALEKASKRSYDELLRTRLLEPLGMSQTLLFADGERPPAMATGYRADSADAPATDWRLGAFAPAGAIVSNVNDLAKFVTLQLRSGEPDVQPVRGGTLLELHTPQRLTDGWNGAVALGWMVRSTPEVGDVVWHNGGMEGFSTFLAFSRKSNVGVVVLANRGGGVEQLGDWLLKQAASAFPPPESPIEPAIRLAAERVCTFIVAQPGDELAELFDPEFLAQVPLPRLKLVLSGLQSEYGDGAQIASAKALPEPGAAEFVVRFKDGRTLTCVLGLTSANPPKIQMLYFRP